MTSDNKKKKSIVHYRRFFCFKNGQIIKEKIEKVRERVQFSTLEPKYAYIIHKAIVSRSYSKEYEKKGFSLQKKANHEALKNDPSLKYGTLSWLFGGNDKSIKEVVDNLIEWKVIIPCQKYRVGESATRYKLTPHWEAEPITMHRYSGRKGSLIYKLNERWNERLKHPIVEATQAIYDHYITLSEEGIRLILKKYPDKRVTHIADALLNGTYEDNKEALQESLAGFAVEPEDVVLFSFFLRNLYCNPIGKGKRLYHSITNLKREYRRFVLINGEPIKEVDITNSQPTFAAAFLIKIHTKQFPGIPLPSDLNLMMDLCRTGKFYEEIAKKAGTTLTDSNRGKFKEEFFQQVFYAKNSDNVRKVKTAFKSLFPHVYQMIKGIKQDNYKKFPLIMQDLEAEIMVYHVYDALLKEGHVVLVLHDAILCSTEQAVERTKQLIKEVFRNWFGQEISFKEK